MSQLVDDFVEFLVGVCVADESTEYLDGILADARSAIAAGKGTVSSLLNSGLNGKSFGRAVHLNALDVARACQQAKAEYEGEDQSVAASYPDFRHLNR